MRLLLIVMVTLYLAFPVSAQASWRVDRAEAIADVVWQHPCGAVPVQVAWEPMDAAVTATVHHGERPPFGRCRIVFNSAEPLDWLNFCTYTIHEYGHLAGFHDWTNPADPEHSSDPNSIMYALFVTDYARCRRRGRPYLELHGLLAHRKGHLRHTLRTVDRKPRDVGQS